MYDTKLLHTKAERSQRCTCKKKKTTKKYELKTNYLEYTFLLTRSSVKNIIKILITFSGETDVFIFYISITFILIYFLMEQLKTLFHLFTEGKIVSRMCSLSILFCSIGPEVEGQDC